MTWFDAILLTVLIVCAVSVSVTRNLLSAIGAGVTSLLFFATLKKIHAIKAEVSGKDGEGGADEN